MKKLWEPLIAMITALTTMIELNIKRYKTYAKMEDKILPVLDRLLDLYPLAEPYVDRALKIAEKASPIFLKKLDENMENVVAGVMDAVDTINITEDWECDDLDEAQTAIKAFNKKLSVVLFLTPNDTNNRKKELYDEAVKAINEYEFSSKGGVHIKAFLLEQIEEAYQKSIKE